MMADSTQYQDEPEFSGGMVNPFTEGLVIQQVLGRERGYPLKRLEADLDDLEPEWVEESIESLETAGVVALKRTRLHMTPALRRLSDLNMVSI
jgi:coproporphyrinogen III oxidase-like Fe-S oxidoreductase